MTNKSNLSLSGAEGEKCLSKSDKSPHGKQYEYTTEKKGEVKTIRQIVIKGNGKIKPAVILTNDFDLPVESIVRKYAKRWLVEKGIVQQIDFFYLNSVYQSAIKARGTNLASLRFSLLCPNWASAE